MKLITIKPLYESVSKADIEQFVEDHGIQSYRTNVDGSIDVLEDLTLHAGWEPHWPKINFVDGNFSWYFVPEGYNLFPYLPKLVSGDCEIPVHKNTFKSSQLPRSSNGVGFLKLTVDDDSKLTLDNDALFTYSKYTYSGSIVGGLEFIPPTVHTYTVQIETNDLSKLSANITCTNFKLTVTDPTAMKGIHKRLSVKATEAAFFVFPSNTPLLGTLKCLQSETFTWYTLTGVTLNGPENTKIRKVMNGLLKTPDLDIIEAQEIMIDAGLKEFAKL